MGVQGFRSVFMVASCAGAALGCYLVSLRVASERAALEEVETRIVLAQRDIRLLQTEIGTRGRLAQLERWNVKVLALSAPSADQFLDGGFALAKLATPEKTVDIEAPLVLASAPAPKSQPTLLEEGAGDGVDNGSTRASSPRQMLHQASLKTPMRAEVADAAAAPVRTKIAETASKPKPTATATVSAKPKPRKTELAKADPLAPVPSGASARASSKEVASKQ